ncbi:hypothetical protein ABB02_00393 [Clostridiaceae bacterium JG1575]|nr:hypothetical protein ABB02_00393 [Clostridiaceae bacterium JG1575]
MNSHLKKTSIRRLLPKEGMRLKPLRLRMLQEMPKAFNEHMAKFQEKNDDYWIGRAEKIETFILSVGSMDVGTIGVEPLGEEGVRLITLWVDPTHRHKGYGRALIREALTVAMARGAEVAVVEVLRENHNAVTCYEEEGFRYVGETKEGVITMEKYLDRDPMPLEMQPLTFNP